MFKSSSWQYSRDHVVAGIRPTTWKVYILTHVLFLWLLIISSIFGQMSTLNSGLYRLSVFKPTLSSFCPFGGGGAIPSCAGWTTQGARDQIPSQAPYLLYYFSDLCLCILALLSLLLVFSFFIFSFVIKLYQNAKHTVISVTLPHQNW